MLEKFVIYCPCCGASNGCGDIFCRHCGCRIDISSQIPKLIEQGATEEDIRELLEFHGESCSSVLKSQGKERKCCCPENNSTQPMLSRLEDCHSFTNGRSETITYYPRTNKYITKRTESNSVPNIINGTPAGAVVGGVVHGIAMGGVLGAFAHLIVGAGLFGSIERDGCENHKTGKEVDAEDITDSLKDELEQSLSKVNSSIFAPAEVSREDYMMVQVYLYRDDEEEKVAAKAKEVDPDAVRKNFIPLDVKLKDGDEVTVHLNMSGKGLELEKSTQMITWHNHYADCQFCVYISEDYKPKSVIGTVILSINGVPAGKMMFKSKIVENPRALYAEIVSDIFKKVFISYSHLDEDKVRYMHEAYNAARVDHFFDRSYLKPGDVYPERIKNYINSADLFILCWSENAKASDYVQIERKEALALAYPQKDMDKATLSIHPISIEPQTDLPEDMAGVYNFGTIR